MRVEEEKWREHWEESKEYFGCGGWLGGCENLIQSLTLLFLGSAKLGKRKNLKNKKQSSIHSLSFSSALMAMGE